MKNLAMFIGALFLVFLFSAFIGNVVKENAAEFQVISIHDLTIKAGVNEKEFETFVMNEIAPFYNKMEGQNLTLVKGDRGIRTDKYSIILTFESIEDRNRIYPPSGEFVGEFPADSSWNKFESMVDEGLGMHHTDYVKVVH